MKIKVCLLQLLKKLTALMLWVFVLSAHAQSVPNNAAASVPAGTLIQTDKGLKPIETFVGGELVWSRSDQTGQFGFKPVVATKATPAQEIFAVEVQNAVGDIEVYETTSEHPFWLKDEGWRKASLLEAGMILVDRHDEPLTVLSMKPLLDLDTVFNIQVHEFETYHVGELGAWVHNAACCEVGTYKELKSTEKVGDNLEHDHIPSFAAVRKAKELELGRELYPNELRQLYNQSIAVEVPKSVHVQSPTYGGKNTAAQVLQDANDLCGAVCRDTAALRKHLLEKGHAKEQVEVAVQQIIDKNRAAGVIK